MPVMLPPGRARLATKPVATGAPAGAMTMGIVPVASLAAWTAGVKIATITSTFDRTSSTARAFARSLRPPAARHDRNVLSLDVGVVPEALAEGLLQLLCHRVRREHTDPRHLPRRLGPGNERRGEEAAGQSTDERPSVQ